jgi:hypothetical protein
MEQNLLSPVPDFKLFKDRAIYIGTFLGGPLVAGYLIAENFKQLGHNGKMKTTWIISIIVTIIMFGVVFLMPNVERVPGYIIPLIYAVVTQYVVKHFQGKDITEHVKNGGQTFSVWRGVWIGVVGLVITLSAILIILLSTNNLN